MSFSCDLRSLPHVTGLRTGPPYLEQRKQEMEEAQAMYDHYIKESLQRGQVQQVAEEER